MGVFAPSHPAVSAWRAWPLSQAARTAAEAARIDLDIRLDSRRASPRPAETDVGAVAAREVQLPFYRQAEIYRRQGIDLDRTMLANGGLLRFRIPGIVLFVIQAPKGDFRG